MPDTPTPDPARPTSETPAPAPADQAPAGQAKAECMNLKDCMELASKHFFFVSDQRLKAFNFYTIITGATLGVSFNVVGKENSEYSPAVATFLGLVNCFIPAVFAMIERRNLTLLNICQEAMRSIELQPGWPPFLRMNRTDLQNKDHSFWRLFFTFRSAVAIVLITHAFIGIQLVLVGLSMQKTLPPHPPVILTTAERTP